MSRYIDIGKLIDELNRREIEHRADIDEVIMTTPKCKDRVKKPCRKSTPSNTGQVDKRK